MLWRASWMADLGRIVRRFQASRPIPIDKQDVARFVERELMPGIKSWLARQSDQESPIGKQSGIVEEKIEVQAVDGSETLVAYVLVTAIEATGKYASVLGGSAGWRKWENGEARVNITLHMNGALSPAEYLLIPSEGSLSKPVRIQPLSSCKHETCLNYGLYSTLIHELTHASESMFKKKLEYKYDRETLRVEDTKAYVNDPKEVRAFMQQIVDEVERYAQLELIRNHAKGDNHKLIDMALKLSTTWREINKLWTPANRAKILKAVYTTLAQRELLF